MSPGALDGVTMSVEDIDRKYNVRPFNDVAESKLKSALTVVKLDAIDLSKYQEGPEGLESRLELAKILEKSVTTYGFFNVINFGFDEARIERLRAIAQAILKLPRDEQEPYLASVWRKEDEPPVNAQYLGGERGQGFKPKGYWPLKNGVRDSITHYNFRYLHDPEKFLSNLEAHPELVRVHALEILEYYNHLHTDVLRKISNLCDLILRLEEGTIYSTAFKVDPRNPDKSAGAYGRFMHYDPPTEEEAAKTGKMWLRGHSDISGFTFITSQPMLTLQIRDYYDGQWKYVDHRPGSLVVNIGDSLEFISGGYFKAAMHRVVEPPQDQRNHDRLVLIYFCNPKEDTPLNPDTYKSSKLRELGLTKADKLKGWEDITFSQWNYAKGKTLGIKSTGEEDELVVYGRNIERWHHFKQSTQTV